MSSDFYNVFSSSTLEDYRQLKKKKPDNLIYLISQVCRKKTVMSTVGDQSYAWRSCVANADRNWSPKHESAKWRDPLPKSNFATYFWGQRILYETNVARVSLFRKSNQRNQNHGRNIPSPLQTGLHYSSFHRHPDTTSVLR